MASVGFYRVVGWALVASGALGYPLAQAGDQPRINSIGMKFIRVPAGEYPIGSNETTGSLRKVYGPLRQGVTADDESPEHDVSISKPYWLGMYEVSLAEFRQFVNDTDYRTEAEADGKGGWGWVAARRSELPRADFTWRWWGVNQSETSPVVNVTYNEAVAFCNWLSDKENKTYRLPTEAEWESACRAGTSTRHYAGDKPADIYRLANLEDLTTYEFHGPAYIIHADGRITNELAPIGRGRDGFGFTAPAGRFRPNPLGFYDMLGNVWEWCADWYAADYYRQSPKTDPKGPATGNQRVVRGGSWTSDEFDCRCARRRCQPPEARNCLLGFRVLMQEEGDAPGGTDSGAKIH
jgi:formylglycine-generating enzyme required for sulfatase activity